MTWTVVLHPLAEEELARIPGREQSAVWNAINKLISLGAQLGYPHSSAIQGVDRVRELRPRGGNSPWRAFYRQIGDIFVIGAIGPEVDVKPRGFKRSITEAQQRLDELEMNP